MSKSSATYQPLPQASMDFSGARGLEKGLGSCGCGQHDHEQSVDSSSPSRGCRSRHSACHSERKKRLARMLGVIALLSLAALTVAAFWSGGLHNLVGCAASALGKRATDDGDSDTFTNKKLYLIIVFVGLFLCLVFGIMLAAWCCRGSFENPCCCPCYLCACCGGLACLECISCGLCAEGVDLAFDG